MPKQATEKIVKKTASRFAVLEQVGEETLGPDGPKQIGIPLFRIANDYCVGTKAAREAGAAISVEGRVLIVCIHEDLKATVKTQVAFEDWIPGVKP
jgi:hypothetical protein